MAVIQWTTEVEVYPDGASSWIARGSARADDTEREWTYDWFEVTAANEEEAYAIAARTLMKRAIVERRMRHA